MDDAPYQHSPAPQLDPEVAAIAAVTSALDGLSSDDERGRVVAFVLGRYGSTVPGVAGAPARGRRG